MKFIIKLLLIFLPLSACGSTGSKPLSAKADYNLPEGNDSIEILPLPEIPSNITDRNEKIAYFLNHYWDALDFRDTTKTLDNDFMEQNFSNYIVALNISQIDEDRRTAIKNLMKKAESDTLSYRKLAFIADDYLYNISSPMMSEDLFIPFMEVFKDSPYLEEADRDRYEFLLEEAMKNRPGMTAADFSYTTRKGEKSTLMTTPVKNEMMLIFYDPDCSHCNEIMAEMAKDKELNQRIKEGDLTLLAIYSGEEYELWKKRAGIFPETWIIGYENGSIDEDELYAFRSSPTIYILDKNKKVIIKDAPYKYH